jgi:hypothetical protein
MLACVAVALKKGTEESSALDWVRLLSDEVGGRRPTSTEERRAAELVADRLERRGVDVEQRPFRSYSTFALPYGVALALALLGAPAARRGPMRAAAAAALGAWLTSAEDGLVSRPLTRLLARHESRNVIATIDPAQEARRTVCLVCHLDSSRSGLMFDRRFLPILHAWIAVQAAGFAVTVAGPLLQRFRWGRRLLAAGYGVLAAGLALLLERELRGVDVPGANDNATGVAAVATLACQLQDEPLERTRVVCLFAGSEEAGVLGSEDFARGLEPRELRSWLFVNFDGVGAPATLRFLRREGVLKKWPADPALGAIAERIAQHRPELGLVGTDRNAGLTYDSTPVLARGGRAITISAQDATIPNYHSPTDTAENLDPAVLENAIEVGREMLAAIDRGLAGSPG